MVALMQQMVLFKPPGICVLSIGGFRKVVCSFQKAIKGTVQQKLKQVKGDTN
jgi:hypothetical protein